MLVLGRKIGEEIIVTMTDGTAVRVVLVDVQGSRAKIGVDAPKDIVIMRKELLSTGVAI